MAGGRGYVTSATAQINDPRCAFSIAASVSNPLRGELRARVDQKLPQCRLDFGAVFYFDHSVPAADNVTSLSAIGGDAHYGVAAFTTTHWSVVLEAQGESPAAREALEKLCRIYWR